MIKIHSVALVPNAVNTSGTVKIVARVSDVSWDNLKATNDSWGTVKNKYSNWAAVLEDNKAASNWNEVTSLQSWSDVRTKYFDWFGVLENIKK